MLQQPQPFRHGGNMLRRGAAATAQQANVHFRNTPQLLGKIFWIVTKKGSVVDNGGITGVGHYGKQLAICRLKLLLLQIFTQMIRPRNTVEASRVNLRASLHRPQKLRSGSAGTRVTVGLNGKGHHHKSLRALPLDIGRQLRQPCFITKSFKQKIFCAQLQKTIHHRPQAGLHIQAKPSLRGSGKRPNIRKDERALRLRQLQRRLIGQPPAGADNLLQKCNIISQSGRISGKCVGLQRLSPSLQVSPVYLQNLLRLLQIGQLALFQPSPA